MPPHPLTKFGIRRYYYNEPKFSGVSSRNILPETMNVKYVKNLDEHKSIEAHWIALYVNDDNVIYLDNFEIKHILKEIKRFIGNKNIKTDIYKMQAKD